jgi:hypothetical protein
MSAYLPLDEVFDDGREQLHHLNIPQPRQASTNTHKQRHEFSHGHTNETTATQQHKTTTRIIEYLTETRAKRN